MDEVPSLILEEATERSAAETARDVTERDPMTARDVTERDPMTARDVTERDPMTARDVTERDPMTARDVTERDPMTARDVTEREAITQATTDRTAFDFDNPNTDRTLDLSESLLGQSSVYLPSAAPYSEYLPNVPTGSIESERSWTKSTYLPSIQTGSEASAVGSTDRVWPASVYLRSIQTGSEASAVSSDDRHGPSSVYLRSIQTGSEASLVADRSWPASKYLLPSVQTASQTSAVDGARTARTRPSTGHPSIRTGSEASGVDVARTARTRLSTALPSIRTGSEASGVGTGRSASAPSSVFLPSIQTGSQASALESARTGRSNMTTGAAESDTAGGGGGTRTANSIEWLSSASKAPTALNKSSVLTYRVTERKQPSTLVQTGNAQPIQKPKAATVRKVGPPPTDPTLSGRRLLVMRHAESMDQIFPGWLRLAYANGHYQPYDLNQPLSIPKRGGGQNDFENDAPLTEMGQVSAQMVGRSLRRNGSAPTVAYSSPALRCVQTANSALKAIGGRAKICIEPGLFEWMKWYERPPQWLTPQELRAAGYAVDCNYKPKLSVQQLLQHKDESSFEQNARSIRTLDQILSQNKEDSIILVVAHSTTVDASVRPLLGHATEHLSREQMEHADLNYPSVCCVALEEEKTGAWRQMLGLITPITNIDFSSRPNYHFLHRQDTDPHGQHLLKRPQIKDNAATALSLTAPTREQHSQYLPSVATATQNLRTAVEIRTKMQSARTALEQKAQSERTALGMMSARQPITQSATTALQGKASSERTGVLGSERTGQKSNVRTGLGASTRTALEKAGTAPTASTRTALEKAGKAPTASTRTALEKAGTAPTASTRTALEKAGTAPTASTRTALEKAGTVPTASTRTALEKAGTAPTESTRTARQIKPQSDRTALLSSARTGLGASARTTEPQTGLSDRMQTAAPHSALTTGRSQQQTTARSSDEKTGLQNVSEFTALGTYKQSERTQAEIQEDNVILEQEVQEAQTAAPIECFKHRPHHQVPA